MQVKFRTCAALLSAALSVGALGGCAGQSEEKPTVVLNVKCPTLQMNDHVGTGFSGAAQFLEKAAADFCAAYADAEVTINLIEFEQTNEDAEIPGCFDTPDAADVLFEGYFNMSTYIHTGRVVPLDDIISDALRADISPSYWTESRLNDKTYMMPFFTAQNTLSFNAELFREAGLEEFIHDPDVVQNWNKEEFDRVFETLKENLSELVSPMMMYAANNQGDTHIMTLLRAFGCPLFDENGRFCVNTPEGIAALRWIKECNDKGYFPAQADTLVIMDNYNQFINGQLAIYINNVAQEANCRREGGFDIYSVNFPDFTEGGVGYATVFTSGFEVFDNGDADKLAAGKAFVKYIYESEYIDYMTGAEPCAASVAEKYADALDDERKYIGNSDANVNLTGNNPNWRGVRAAFYPNIRDLLFGDKTPEEVAANIDAACNAAIEEGYAESVLHE
ncbi:MAG: extracellular solute-binding protein [Bacteroides sp.]|nr:extracellular solute-binding protein [Eubacterium sp.]MCM1417917.1 extracellular solute-binding protein [Roseburia sp.]MCM1461920.1 extracellular solute-binding protein [Bacteroides sp.]